jgi:dihydroflavonol-4-reductase
MDLVTGANGFIGNVLVKELLNRGRKVRSLCRRSSDMSSIDGLDIEGFTGDILNIESLIKAFEGVETVYHLAGIISIMPGNKKRIREINYGGTINVIKACKACGVRKLVYTSTIHALKEPPDSILFDENMPFDTMNQRGEYDRSKALASKAVIDASDRDGNGKGLQTFVVCPTGTIGPYDYKISSVTMTLLDYCMGRVKISVNGAYDFVDVRDVAAGHIMAAERGNPGSHYILSGQRVTMDDMMEILRDNTGIPKPRIIFPIWLARSFCYLTPIYYYISGQTPRYTAYAVSTLNSNSNISHKKASDDLGYDPMPVRQSIEDALKWLEEIGKIKLNPHT